jgi:hypothetical protein
MQQFFEIERPEYCEWIAEGGDEETQLSHPAGSGAICVAGRFLLGSGP